MFNKKILIIDDDRRLLSSIEEVLKEYDYKVKSLSSPDLAKFAIKLINYDIILTDIRMPQIDGIDLLEYIKNRSNTPVILMSGESSAPELTKNADAFIKKPFKINELIEIFEKF